MALEQAALVATPGDRIFSLKMVGRSGHEPDCGGGCRPIAVSRSSREARYVLRYTFHQETHSWIPGLCDYSLDATALRFKAEVRKLPDNFPSDLRAYYLQSHNTPDDLFMFLKKELSASDGIEPDRTYGVSIHVGFLSNAPSGLAGIGGSPGEDVVLKAGVSLLEPVASGVAQPLPVGPLFWKKSQVAEVGKFDAEDQIVEENVEFTANLAPPFPCAAAALVTLEDGIGLIPNRGR